MADQDSTSSYDAAADPVRKFRPSSSDCPTDVYRLYNGDGALLYVGVGANGYARLDVHRRQKCWWPSVRRVVMTQYRSRWAALYVEACAIRDENPVYNVAQNRFTCEARAARAGDLTPLERDEFEVA